ncbi:hepatic triacylglycerol lipase-like [Ctenocephalides felis]|uniref:hepatic triacylglycerol lipase-like n=1 Tax=Ctenocephalides felis TaxID=7515 RepID=UPI000E6E38EC|nr:hepatic triacylglycerol lipase-like [Ctenocephalides felis]
MPADVDLLLQKINSWLKEALIIHAGVQVEWKQRNFTGSDRLDRERTQKTEYTFEQLRIMKLHVTMTHELKYRYSCPQSWLFCPNATKKRLHTKGRMGLTPLVFMRYRYLRSGPVNVIAMDWEALSSGPCYIAAVSNSRPAGVCVAQLVSRLRDAGATNIHIIGFSLGAHVPNFAAVKLRPYKLSRITGLDPAMPLFAFSSLDGKLDPTDAEFVDVFHTNALIQGKMERCGHADFYFNGGVAQPGCGVDVGCSHHRAADYFAESIKGDGASPVGFWSWPCPSFTHYIFGLCLRTQDGSRLAGEHCSRDTRGMFLVETRSKPPYAKGIIIDPEEERSISPRCWGPSCLNRIPTTAQPVYRTSTFHVSHSSLNNDISPEITTKHSTRKITPGRKTTMPKTTAHPNTLGIIRVEMIE